MQHVYDFYKPDLQSEYPVVDGKLSIQCYLGALDRCYQRYAQRATAKESRPFSLESTDGVVFHSPYCKLVQKSLARLMLTDFLSDPRPDFAGKYSGLEAFRDVKLEDTYFNRDVEKAMMAASKEMFQSKTASSLLLANQVGNMYTPSVYGGLISFIAAHTAEELAGKRVLVFSYGSGLAASMFSLRITSEVTPTSPLLPLISSVRDLKVRLDSRKKLDPDSFAKVMKLREETHHLAPYSPVGSTDDLFPGTWYLTHVDDMHRRTYDCKRAPPVGSRAPSAVSDVTMTGVEAKKAQWESPEGQAPIPS